MDFETVIHERDLASGRQPARLGLRLRVRWFSWSVEGGPDAAEVEAEGSTLALWALTERLRCPLEIVDRQQRSVWWGFISAVRLPWGNRTAVLRLEEMANRVGVRYRPVIGASGDDPLERQVIWVNSAESQRIYGVKEKLIEAGHLSAAQAAALAGAELARHALPRLEWIGSDICEQGQAVIQARGWWQTLDWKRYTQPAGLEQNSAPASAFQEVGNQPGSAHLLQTFQLMGAEGWRADRVQLRVAKVGDPGDDLAVFLQDETGTSTLASGQLASEKIGLNPAWVEVPLNVEIYLAPSTTYRLRVGRSGGLNAANDYRVDLDEVCCYAPGEFSLWNGFEYVSRNPPADLIFRLVGVSDTAAQLGDLLAPSSGGQFLTGVTLPGPSGIKTGVFRDGTYSALREARALLALGGANGRRLLAGVDRSRHAAIWEAPGAGEADFALLPDGRVAGSDGSLLAEGSSPTGVWVVPAGLPASETTRVLIEHAVFDAKKGLRLG